jgi:thiosulfate/3-mercaptopyruvate sulfurtransferase
MTTNMPKAHIDAVDTKTESGIKSFTTLISVAQLQTLRASGIPHVVFDCSFDLMNAAIGPQQFEAAHIPGAHYAHLNTDLSDKTGSADTASGGRHPLPSRERFAHWVGSTGLTPGMQAVVYDRNGVNYCGRLWWMLKWLGHDAVAVLDGGLQAWTAAGEITESGASTPSHSEVKSSSTPYPFLARLVSLFATQTIANNLDKSSQTLIDARAPARFKGEVEPMDPVAGHIPGALNRPFSHNIDADGKFKPAAVLKAEFEALLAGRDPASVVHHCGSGVSALPNLIAMEIAGLGRTGLYAGSWSEWCTTPGLPVGKG